MKKNKVFIILGIILLNVLVALMIFKGVVNDTNKYDETLAQARAYSEQELCVKAISEYEKVLAIEDTVDLRIELISVYEKAVEIGEISSTYDMFEQLNILIEKNSKNPYAYEYACESLYKYEKYEECSKYLTKAQELELTSDKLTEVAKNMEYKYTKVYCMYNEVLPEYDEMYVARSEGMYSFLSSSGAEEISNNYTYASSFSEGYAFVKSLRPDGTEDSYLIDKDAVRQVYFPDVETSSGVGKAKNAEEKDILLLA